MGRQIRISEKKFLRQVRASDNFKRLVLRDKRYEKASIHQMSDGTVYIGDNAEYKMIQREYTERPTHMKVKRGLPWRRLDRA